MKRQKHHQRCKPRPWYHVQDYVYPLVIAPIPLNNLNRHPLKEEGFELEGRFADLREWRWLYGI